MDSERKEQLVSVLDSFEQAAEAFYKATGYLMPGKDMREPLDEESEQERRYAFKVWCAAVEHMKERARKEEDALREELKRKVEINIELIEKAAASAEVLIRERDEARTKLQQYQKAFEWVTRAKGQLQIAAAHDPRVLNGEVDAYLRLAIAAAAGDEPFTPKVLNYAGFDSSKLDIHAEQFKYWLDRAGRLITCSWFIGSIRHRSEDKWVPIALFADEENGRFAYAFEIRGGEPEVAAFCKRLRDSQLRCTELNG